MSQEGESRNELEPVWETADFAEDHSTEKVFSCNNCEGDCDEHGPCSSARSKRSATNGLTDDVGASSSQADGEQEGEQTSTDVLRSFSRPLFPRNYSATGSFLLEQRPQTHDHEVPATSAGSASTNPWDSMADDCILAPGLQHSVDTLTEGAEMKHLLGSCFGFESFRKGQAEIILSVLKGESVLAELPTAWGKTLCYQFAIFMEHLLPGRRNSKGLPAEKGSDQKFCLVVSPLLSLVQDQIDSIKHTGIPLECLQLSSGLSGEREQVLFDRLAGKGAPVDIVFVSPERLAANQNLRRALAQAYHRVAFVCVDEAHCVSEWSHDFRPTYLHIFDALRQLAPPDVRTPPVMALTATVSGEIRREVMRIFNIERHVSCIADNQRENLQLKAVPLEVSATASVSEVHGILQNSLQSTVSGLETPMIVYVSTQNECDQIAQELRAFVAKKNREALRKRGRDAADDDPVTGGEELVVRSYHAGMTLAQRHRTQKAFLTNEVHILVATIAFGMGINKADVRSIVHFHVPPSLEAYVQEIGRAGRDGLPSMCVLLYNPQRFFELRSRMAANLLTFDQAATVVRSILSPPTRVSSDSNYDFNYVYTESIALQVQCPIEVVETILFQAAASHPELLALEGLLPLRATVTIKGVNDMPRKHRHMSKGVTTTAIHEQLSLRNPVLDYCKELPTRQLDIQVASSALQLTAVELVQELKEFSKKEEGAVVSCSFQRYGYVLRYRSRALENANHVNMIVKEIFAKRQKQYQRATQRLEATFAALQNPCHDTVALLLEGGFEALRNCQQQQAQQPSSDTAEMRRLLKWKAPTASLKVLQAVDIIADLYRTDRARITGPLEAAKVLCGATSFSRSTSNMGQGQGDAMGSILESTWRRHPHFGRLCEFDVFWVEKACTAHHKIAAVADIVDVAAQPVK